MAETPARRTRRHFTDEFKAGVVRAVKLLLGIRHGIGASALAVLYLRAR